MSNVIPIGGYTRLDIDPDKVLEGAKNKLSKVLVIGYESESDNIYFAASTSNTAELLFMLEKFKFKVLRGDFNPDE